MGIKAKNVSSGDQNIEISMDSKYLVLIDLLVLDGLSREFASHPDPICVDPVEFLEPYSSPLRIGVYEIPDFKPGVFGFSAKDLTVADPEDKSPEVVYVDTGELVLVDFSHLNTVAKHLTWEQYDLYLQAPFDDDSIILSINKMVGGAYFGIIGADTDTEFNGDGSYKLKPSAGMRVEG